MFSDFRVNRMILPSVGFGTFQSDQGNEHVKDVVIKALRNGYRHIDTAAAYGNEQAIGEAIQGSGVPRDQIFVTTKTGRTWHHPAEVEEGLDQSLHRLQLEYVDLLLMHFPYAHVAGPNHSKACRPDGQAMIDLDLSRKYPETWTAMEELVRKGKTKLIGLSNFNILKTKRILDIATIRPAVNQVELHPYLPQPELLAFCNKEGIHVTAHQPLGGKPLANVNPNANHPGPIIDADILSIASEYGKSPAQVLLSWAVQRGTSVVPKTVREDRMAENRALFRLSDEHMAKISNLAQTKGTVRFLDPKKYVGFDVFDENHDEPTVERG